MKIKDLVEICQVFSLLYFQAWLTGNHLLESRGKHFKNNREKIILLYERRVIDMEYIYIKVKPEKWNDFIELLDSKRIIYSYIGRKTIMIHKMYFVGVGKILDNSMIESFASTIEGLL